VTRTSPQRWPHKDKVVPTWGGGRLRWSGGHDEMAAATIVTGCQAHDAREPKGLGPLTSGPDPF
jgi:hypothetical protein